jgi:hypothetical protein
MSALPPISTKKADIDYVGFVPIRTCGLIAVHHFERVRACRGSKFRFNGLANQARAEGLTYCQRTSAVNTRPRVSGSSKAAQIRMP